VARGIHQSIHHDMHILLLRYTNIAEEDVSERDVTIANSQLQQPQEM